MARGRARGYDEQRDAIVARGAELFARHGFHATSMSQLAEATGLSKPTLYHYYRDKDAMLVQIAEGHVSRLAALVDAVDALRLPPEARLRELIRRILAEYADAQHAHRVLTEDVKFLPPADRARILDRERHVVARFADAVAALRPELRDAALDKPLTMLLFGMINWLFTWMKPDRALDHEALAPLVTELFLGGLPAVRVPQPAALAD